MHQQGAPEKVGHNVQQPSGGSQMSRAMTPAKVGVALMNVDQVAARLGVTPRFVRRLVDERRIPFVKVGKFVRFDPVDVENWIEANRVGTFSPAPIVSWTRPPR